MQHKATAAHASTATTAAVNATTTCGSDDGGSGASAVGRSVALAPSGVGDAGDAAGAGSAEGAGAPALRPHVQPRHSHPTSVKYAHEYAGFTAAQSSHVCSPWIAGHAWAPADGVPVGVHVGVTLKLGASLKLGVTLGSCVGTSEGACVGVAAGDDDEGAADGAGAPSGATRPAPHTHPAQLKLMAASTPHVYCALISAH